jgi:Holliday junction resolvase RusA-like endonuclease
MTVYEFFVPGLPKPKGSMNAFVVKGRVVMTSAAGKGLKTWNAAIRQALLTIPDRKMIEGPVRMHVNFYLPKPKKPTTTAHLTPPDLDKCVRGILDPMTGVLFRDDSQVTALWTTKEYAGESGCGARVRVEG